MKYNFEINELDPENGFGKVLSQIKPGSTVLECGCATGYMTRYMKEKLNCSVSIIEIEAKAYEIACEYATDGICTDLMGDEWCEKFRGKRFDYILFCDVLEHVCNPAALLKKSVQFLKRSGQMIVSLPNILHNDILIKMYEGRWDYQDRGLLDDTHIRFWGVRNVESFFEEAGLKVTIFNATWMPTGRTEQYWKEECCVDPDFLETLYRRRNGTIYQFILTVQTMQYVEENDIKTVYHTEPFYQEQEFPTLGTATEIIRKRSEDKMKLEQFSEAVAAQNQMFSEQMQRISEENKQVLQSAKEINRELSSSVSRLYDGNQSLMVQNAEMMQSVQRLQNEIIALTVDNRELSSSVSRLSDSNQSLMAQNAGLAQITQRLQQENDALAANNRELSSSMSRLSDGNSLLTAQNTELTQNVQQLQQANDALAEKNNKLVVQNDTLEGANMELAEKITLLSQHANQIEVELQQAQVQVQQQTEEIARAWNAHASIWTEKEDALNKVNAAEQELAVANSYVQAINESRAHHMAEKYYRVRNKVFPIGSRRRKIVGLIARGTINLIHPPKSTPELSRPKNQIDKLHDMGKYNRMDVITTQHCMFIAKLVKRALERVGIACTIYVGEPESYQDIPYLIICPQFVKNFPPVYFVFQMEQTISSRWFTKEYFVSLQNSCVILDYALQNVEFFHRPENEDVRSRVYYLPIDYYPQYIAEPAPEEKEYDVLFYGSIAGERRGKKLEEIGKRYNIKIISDLFGEELYREIQKAKVIVNIHYYEGALVETTRLYEALSLNSSIIVSEDSFDKNESSRLEEFVDFVPVDDTSKLLERIGYWLSHDEERKEKVRANRRALEHRANAFDFFFYRFLLAHDRVSFDEFYNMSGNYFKLETNRVCLSLPESTERRRSFDKDNQYGFQCIPGLRHEKGWVGCGMSYKLIFRKAKEAKFKNLMICEDDVIFPVNFTQRLQQIMSYLGGKSRWSVFSGVMADVGKVNVLGCEEKGGTKYVNVDHMVSMVFNIYNKEMFNLFNKWDESDRNVETNAIDRYLEGKKLMIFMQIPFLVGHKEELHSTIWGFSNSQYAELIANSEEKLRQLAEELKEKINRRKRLWLSMVEKKERLRRIMKRILKSELFISIMFFIMTICIFGPLELYITNQAELWFSFPDMLKIVGIMCGVSVIVLGGIGLLLRGKLRNLYSALLFIATLCLYIQGNYLNISYGLLDGRTIEWGAYSNQAVINTLCWIAAIVGLLLLRKKKPQMFQRIIRIVSLFIIAVQILTLGILFINKNVLTADEESQLTVDHMTEIGSKDNIVIFVLDTFDDPLMDTLMETDGEHYQSLFTDFTRFTDCAAGGATTAAAMPIIISGEYYPGGVGYSDYVNRSFNTDGLYTALKERNYNIGLYTRTDFVGNGANGYVDNYVEGEGKPSSYLGLTSQYSKFTLFKYMPHILKQFFWLYTAEFDEYRPGDSYVFDDADFYQTIKEDRLRVEGENSFRLFHLMGPHYPYTINEFAQLDNTTTRMQQAKGNLYIVEEYIKQMKACGVYDDAMIIITADHGDSASYSAPILFVKQRGVTGTYAENDAPVSHIDLHPTLFSYLGMDNGDSFFDISQAEQRDRLFHLRIQEAGSFYMREYVISDKVAVVGTGTNTGRKLAPAIEKKPVQLGKAMSLCMDGEANVYVVSGLDVWPLDSMETQGTETVFSFPLEEPQIEKLDVSIEVARIYDEAIKQSVQVYANGQLCHEEPVTGTQTINFLIPAELLTGQTLELKLVYGTKVCPLYLSGITIGSEAKGAVVNKENAGFIAIISTPLTALMRLCYNIVHNYGLAIVLFTLLTKVILFPISMWVQKNGISMVRMTPEINRLKINYYGDKDTIAEETQALYKREKYHPLASTIPMIVQLVLLIGVINAVKATLGGVDTMLTAIPSEAGGVTLLMPMAAGLAALALGLAQNKLNPLQREQGKAEQWMTNGISVAISLFLGVFVPLGVGVYWIASNLFSILQQALLNQIIKPQKYIDYAELENSKTELANMNQLSAGVSKEDKKREKTDYKRFFSVANKHLVFYSEKSGFYKYFKNIIEYLIRKSNVVIHYVTSDPDDQIFELAKTEKQIRAYYIGEKKLITLMMKMDADIVVMTMPDLDKFHLKRSYVRKDIEYIYMFHGVITGMRTLRPGALDHYDTVLTTGAYIEKEIRLLEELNQTKKKKLVPCGYGVIEQMAEAYAKMEKTSNRTPYVLIAPSWQEENILESCLVPLCKSIIEKGYDVIVRPHPQYLKRFPHKFEQIQVGCRQLPQEHMRFETDFSSNETVFRANLLITDWSSIGYEYALATTKPVLFIDTPMKVVNEQCLEIEKTNPPFDMQMRKCVGYSLKPEDTAEKGGSTVQMLLDNLEQYQQTIEKVRAENIYHFGESGKYGAEYIIDSLMERKAKQK